ncbi:MAG: hypothetical protein CVV64_14825 [Candidatus Wallbacteria bacterium HGW-Wallbacteria-1]|jgi:hypothetical protein|uniref:HEAT repeat domain-containing protein n=1 Tax=Candidatus Wallbacteria bacterium HGW-Wallbacteria-1 TaxID=2013854 RepID=A0A2N1PLY0_9BACT|nr:MAG: hypothetical protein CVV64_14825 [Candidatus Wallbacteria bacterium HGW-Wallbacteria-1]
MDKSELNNLRLCLQDPASEVRQSALVRIVREGISEILDSVITMADTDPDPKLRYYAKKGIQILKSAAAEKKGDDKSGQHDSSMDQTARNQRISLVISNLAALDSEKRTLAIKAAAALGAAELLSPMSELLSREIDPFNISQIITFLGKNGKARPELPLSGLIIPFLSSEDARIRANSVEALETLGDPEALKHILPLLQDPDNRCRANAISALKNHGEVNVFNNLQEMICSDMVWMQDSAAFVLGMINSPNSVMLLSEAVNSRHQVVRLQARNSLEKLAASNNQSAMELLATLPAESRDSSQEPAMALFTDLAEESFDSGLSNRKRIFAQDKGNNSYILLKMLKSITLVSGNNSIARAGSENVSSLEWLRNHRVEIEKISLISAQKKTISPLSSAMIPPSEIALKPIFIDNGKRGNEITGNSMKIMILTENRESLEKASSINHGNQINQIRQIKLENCKINLINPQKKSLPKTGFIRKIQLNGITA